MRPVTPAGRLWLAANACASGARVAIASASRVAVASRAAVYGLSRVAVAGLSRVAVAGLSCIALASLPRPACAESAPLWPAAIDTVKVVGARPFPEERLIRPRGFVQVVPLGPSIAGSRDLGDLLEGVAGVQVRRLGGIGAISMASIRGSAPSQVEVRIDDIPISAGADGISNLALLPAHLFSRLEVGRGPLASIDGGSGAGVIRLITSERFDLPLSIHAGAGSFGSRSLAAVGGIARGPVSLLLSGGTLASRGDYRYLDRGATPFESADDRMVRRTNNALDQQDVLVRARWAPTHRPAGPAVDYLMQGVWKDGGVPGTESRQTLRVHDRFRRLLQSIGMRGASEAGFSWKLAVRSQDEVDRFRNPDGEIGLGRADAESRFVTRGIDGGVGRSIPDLKATVRIDGSLSRERLEQRDFMTAIAAPDRRRGSRSLAVEAASQPFGTRIDLYGSQRWTAAEEASASRIDLAAPRLGCAIVAGRGLSFRGGAGRFGRLPSFVERFGRGGVQVGNASLRPERGTSRDAGIVLLWPATGGRLLRMQLEVTGFETRTADAIVWIQNSQRTTRAQNLERTKVIGSEATLRWMLQSHSAHRSLSQQATATFQDPRDDGPSTTYHGRELPYIPRRKGAVETRLDFGALHLIHRIDHESSFFRDRYNSPGKRRGPRTLQDLEAGRAFAKGRIDLTLAVQNVTNQQAQDVEGFPLPGRSVSLDVTFRPEAGKGE